MYKKITVGIFTNMAPLYVRPLWDKLVDCNDIKYTFISSVNGHEGIKTIDPAEFLSESNPMHPDWQFVKNIYIGNVLIYQVGLIRKVLQNELDIYVFLGDMYNISTWVASVICKIHKKPVLFWGHGYYGNEGFLKKNIRLFFYRIANYHFLYGNRERNLLIELGFKAERLFTVYNSLDYTTHKQIYDNRSIQELIELKKSFFPWSAEYPTLLFIGRLTKQKKLSLLLDAIQLQKEKGNRVNCIVIGDGHEKEELIDIVKKLKLEDWVHFHSSCYDDIHTAKLIMLADCCVSPGNIGLTAIHCLSLGTPVITHNNFSNQMPEVESVINNQTGFFFEENNVESLSEAIDNFLNSNQKQRMEAACLNIIREKFNPQNQCNIISAAINKVYSAR